MSIDYALFKLDPGCSIEVGLAYLLASGNVDSAELQKLDVQKLRDQIGAAFPGLFDAKKNDLGFQCQLTPQAVLLETYNSTPDDVVLWFQELALKEGMKFFDPQCERVTKRDEAEFNIRILDTEKDDELFKAAQEMPQLTARAKSGDAHALFLLGNRFSFGEGIAIDKRKAFNCYKASANAGDPDGMFNLAACYRFGDGVAKDLHKALEWYERAAEIDKIFAPFALGEIYKNGEGVPVNLEKAIEYFSIARENGNQDAVKQLRKIGALPPLTNRNK